MAPSLLSESFVESCNHGRPVLNSPVRSVLANLGTVSSLVAEHH